MTTETVDLARIADTLEALRQEVARLGQRVAALEASRSGEPSRAPGVADAARTAQLAAASVPPAPSPVAEGLSEELVLVISAAIAAYLGKKTPIRQIRLLGSAAWSQQGRVTIQASHELVLSRQGR
jgi:methylmalonyl-CoA carboxyltransferase 12S subunit